MECRWADLGRVGEPSWALCAHHIERWWSAQGRSSPEGREKELYSNLSSLASYYILVYTCIVTTRYQ